MTLPEPATEPRLDLPAGHPPVLAVVVEGAETQAHLNDLDLAQGRVFAPRGLRPLVLVDHDLVADRAAARQLRRRLFAGEWEIGAHLLPARTPPHDERPIPANAFPGNLPEGLERAKLARLTERLVDAFAHHPPAFKAGRSGFGPNTGRLLARFGYRVDLSVVARHSFTADGGPDFRRHDGHPRLGPRGLVRLPVSGGYWGPLAHLAPALPRRLHLPGLMRHGALRPECCRLDDLVRLVRALRRQGIGVFTLALCARALSGAEGARIAADLAGFLAFFRDRLGGEFRTPAEIARILAPAHQAGDIGAGGLQQGLGICGRPGLAHRQRQVPPGQEAGGGLGGHREAGLWPIAAQTTILGEDDAHHQPGAVHQRAAAVSLAHIGAKGEMVRVDHLPGQQPGGGGGPDAGQPVQRIADGGHRAPVQ